MGSELAALDGVRLIDVPAYADPRGVLYAFERARPLPFTPVRTFIIADVPEDQHRAQHTVSCDQLLWAAAGACDAGVRAHADSPRAQERRFRLVARGSGLYLPEGVWLDLSDFSVGSVLVCLAAAGYDAQRKN